MMRVLCILWCVSALLEAAPNYERDIVPILRTYCGGCHNEDDFEGDFSLETYAALLEGGSKGNPIESANPGESYLIKTIEGRAKALMPPEDEPRPSDSELAMLREWIADGAKGPVEDVSIFANLTVPEIEPSSKRKRTTALTVSNGSSRHVLATATFQHLQIAEKDLEFAAAPGKINALNFSPNASTLIGATGITGLSGKAVLWDVATGASISEFGGHRDILYDAEFSPDGKLLATAGYDTTIRIWEVSSEKLLRTIEVHNGAVFDLEFSPDGTILASASADETVKLWRVSDGVRLDTLNQPQGEMYAVEFSEDGRYIVAGGVDNRLRVWRLVSRQKPKINPVTVSRFAHEGGIVAIALRKNRMVSAADDGTVKVWSFPDLTELHDFGRLPGIATGLEFVSDDELAFASLETPLRRLKIPAKRQREAVERDEKQSLAPKLAGDAPVRAVAESEPNTVKSPTILKQLPAIVSGVIDTPADTDLFRFHARKGEEWVLEIDAARSKSKLDSKVEVLTNSGEPIEQVVLQAVRDSWFTFRGKDSKTSDDFRVHNWREMELNELLYANGEVVKLWMYPRGPDSGFRVYPGFGSRHGWFGTTPVSQALGAPCYIVKALKPGSKLVANGLPVFPIYFENDDDSRRRWGADSQLFFTAPAEGDYLARVSDVREFGGAEFGYKLTVRPRKQDFKVTMGGKNLKVVPGSGAEFSLVADRIDGFDGAIEVEIADLPAGFTTSSPIVIEAGQDRAFGVLNSAADTTLPPQDVWKAVRFTAEAGELGKKDVGGFEKVEFVKKGAIGLEIVDRELVIRAGETITAVARITRPDDFKSEVNLGKEDAARNLPHGLFVANAGLSGLTIVAGSSERRFSITAAPWVKPCERWIHLKTGAGGGQASFPVRIRVVK